MKYFLTVPALLAFILVGCATTPPADQSATPNRLAKAQSPEQAVTARAQARWDAVIAAEYEKAYGFLSEGFRDVTPLDAYRLKQGSNPFKIKSAYISKVRCEEADACTASVTLTVETLMPSVGTKQFYSTEEEPWFLQGGQWFHVPPK